MPKYMYTGKGGFFQGLPARDLDTDELSAEQRDLLTLAVEFGYYTALGEPGMFERSFDELLAKPARDTAQEHNVATSDDLLKEVSRNAKGNRN